MKVFFNSLAALSFSLLLFSCEQDDRFSGAPDPSKVNFVELPATISTTEINVVSGQQFPITLDISPQTFDVDVNIEVISFLPNINKRARKTFTIKAGETTVSGKMNAPSGDQGATLPFTQNMNLYMSAITTAPKITSDGVEPIGFAGKQYSISSNTVVLGYGDSAFGGVNSNRCAVRFDWKNPPGGGNPFSNNLNIRLKRDGNVVTVATQSTQPINGTTTSTSRYESLNFLSSAPDGTYVVEAFAAKLTSTPDPIDVPIRFTVRYPNEDVKTFASVLTGLTVGTASDARPVFQIIKTTVDGQANYAISLL
ncbi:MAG: hypothetical protein JST78_12345 [Bacteroidetes bacterium]|nr:hypothetical protein [Bacteroidota bacterium]